MSPNKNYVSGRRFEYKRKAFYTDQGCTVIRASGSHGVFDLVVFDFQGPVKAIQCKRVESRATALRLTGAFRSAPPLPPNRYFLQVMEVYVKSTKELISTTV